MLLPGAAGVEEGKEMSRVKRIGRFGILGIAAVSLVASIAFAEAGPWRGGGPGGRPALRAQAKARIQRAADSLGLTEQQRAQMREQMEKCRREAADVRNSNLTPEQKRARLLELRAQCRSEMAQILTPEQRERAGQMWRERGPMGWKAGRAGRAAWGMDALNLTPEQKARIESIRSETRERVWNIRTDTRLTEKEKAEKIEAARRAGHEQVMGILTPEQKAKIETWRANCPRLGAGGFGGPGMGFGARRGAP